MRDFTSNRFLFCDGMTNNAKFVEYKGSAGKFPLNYMKKRLEKAYFVRSTYANFANKNGNLLFVLNHLCPNVVLKSKANLSPEHSRHPRGYLSTPRVI